jgi:hypothetical protein
MFLVKNLGSSFGIKKPLSAVYKFIKQIIYHLKWEKALFASACLRAISRFLTASP